MSANSEPAPDLTAELVDLADKSAKDPLLWVETAFPWGVKGTELADKTGPRTWQREILEDIGVRLRANKIGAYEVIQEAVASGHGIGKSALVAWLILWAMSTMDDTKGVVTANTENQLKTKTWAELSKWHRLCFYSHWFKFTATALFSSEPDREKTWRIDMIPWSEKNSEAFAGLHNEGRRILLIFDEASAIPDSIWEVAEGALTDEDTEIIWCAFGNPTRNVGRFRECFRRYRHRWTHRNIDSRDVDGTNKKKLQQWIDDYGLDSDFAKVRVRGMFPSASAKQFITTDDVDAGTAKHLREEEYKFAPKIIGVDPAWEGDDEFAIYLRQGLYSKRLATYPKNDNDIDMANRVAWFEDEYEADAVFIDAGYGTGIVSAGHTMGRGWVAVWFSGKSGDPGCLNKRAEMWNLMKQWLKIGGSIEDDPVLYQDLISPETVPRLDGKIQLQSKDTMKRDGLPSPNRADALALTFAFPVAGEPRLETHTEDQVIEHLLRKNRDHDYNPLDSN